MDITANLKYSHRVEVIITVVAWLIDYREMVILNHYVFYLCVTLSSQPSVICYIIISHTAS